MRQQERLKCGGTLIAFASVLLAGRVSLDEINDRPGTRIRNAVNEQCVSFG